VAQARNGVWTWLHSDHLHSATVITDVNGQEVRRLAYKAFGEEVQNTGSGDAPPYTYTGKELDDTGLYYYGARYYDPVLARFLTPDTVYDGNSPQGLNRYSYALNNPIIYRDPTGHQSFFPSGFWDSIFGQHLAQEIHGTEQALTTIASDATDQVVYGNYTDKGNIVGTTAMVLAGGLGIDLPADLRDLCYDVTHWQPTWGHAAQTAVDVAALLPLIGSLKYVDDVGTVVKSSKVLENLDEAETLSEALKKPTRFIEGVQVKQFGKTIQEGTVDLQPTLERIQQGIKHPHHHDGTVFKNLEGKLPKKPEKYYTEYVVETVGEGAPKGPGPQRLITGKNGEMYYTPDHYESFIPVNQ